MFIPVIFIVLFVIYYFVNTAYKAYNLQKFMEFVQMTPEQRENEIAYKQSLKEAEDAKWKAIAEQKRMNRELYVQVSKDCIQDKEFNKNILIALGCFAGIALIAWHRLG